MIQGIVIEAIGWLGYLQRGEVNLQIILIIILIALENQIVQRLQKFQTPGVRRIVTPSLAFVTGFLLQALGLPGLFLSFLGGLWLTWRALVPIKNLVKEKHPKWPVDEVDQTILRPAVLVIIILTFFQMLGSREALAMLPIGTVFGVVLTVGKLLTALLLGYAVVTLSRQPAGVLSGFFTQFFGLTNQSRTALEVILQYSLIGVGIVVVANYLGINGAAMVTVAGGLSVGIGFGLKEIISNFISSIWMLFEGTVRPGEILMINGDPCTVRRLGLRATQLKRGRDGAELLIPNQTFFTQEAESFTAQETSRRGAVDVGAAYHHEPGRVIDILVELAKEHEKVLPYPAPAAFTTGFADSSINYKVLFWVRNPLEAFQVESDLRQVIWSRFEENEIGIPFPQRQVYPMEWPPSKQQTLEIRQQPNQHLLPEQQQSESSIDDQHEG
jgi:potassium efflux system protein